MGGRRVLAAVVIVLTGVLGHVSEARAQSPDAAVETDSFSTTADAGACDQLAGGEWWELKSAGCPIAHDDGGPTEAPAPPPPPGPADLAVSQPIGSSAMIVENHGPGTATGVALRATYSSSLAIGFPGVATAHGSCAAPPAGTLVGPGGVSFSCELGSLVPGEVATVTIAEPPAGTMTAAGPVGGTFPIPRSNVVSVSGTTPDPHPENNTSSLTSTPGIRTADFAPPPPETPEDP
jgi:hypothetical protein